MSLYIMSSVEIVELKKPKLRHVKMLCDEIIDPKLTKYPMISDCWGYSSYNIICGRMGQGKSSFIINLLKNREIFKKTFNNVFVMIPEGSRLSIENDFLGQNLPPDKLYDDLTIDTITDVYERLQEESKEKHTSLLIIDDFNASLKQKDIIKVLQKIITKHRHLRTTIFLLQQNFQALAKPLRELITNIIFFDLGKSQLSKIFDEALQIKQEMFEDIVEKCFKNPHDWVCINLRSRRIYTNFDEVLFSES